MGKCLTFYVFLRQDKHDNTRVCFNLSYQPEKYSLGDYDEEDVCNRCLLYIGALYSGGWLDKFEIIHSYSNEIWSSKWNIANFYIGDSNTDFIHRFSSSECMYREISNTDVNYLSLRIEKIGNPYTKIDKEAKEETLRVLNFLMKYNDDKYILLIDDE